MTASVDLMEGWEALEGATDAYLEAMAYYKGTVAERFSNERVRQLVEASGQSYRFRLAAIPVKVMAKRCRISNVTSDKEPVTALLDHIREANQAGIYESLIMKKAFTYGDAYALTWPVEEDATAPAEDGDTTDAPVDPEVAQVRVEISYQSPLHCRVLYDGEDGRRPRYAIRRWLVKSPLGEGQKSWHAELWYADGLERWRTKPGTKGANQEDWEPYILDAQDEEVPVLPGEEVREAHPWGEIPIKHFRTDLPYGEPAHFAAYGPQDAITKAITTQVVVDVEAHGWPERYRLLRDQRLLEAGQEPVNWGDSAQAPVAATDGTPATTGRRRGSGLEHTYAGTEKVGEYTSPDPGALLGPIDKWVQLMSVVTETPLDELDATVQLSGVSREKADAPLKEKAKDAKSYLEGTWADLYHLAARQAGMVDPGVISIHWTPPEVTMDTDWWATAKLRMELGVPVEQILAEANYLPEQVQAWLDREGEAMALLQRVSVLERIGAAAQTLGVAVQTGVMDEATVKDLMKRVVGEVQTGANRSGGQ